MSVLLVHAHGFNLLTYARHLFFDGCADCGGFYASRLCPHRRHRIAVAIAIALVSTLALVTLVG